MANSIDKYFKEVDLQNAYQLSNELISSMDLNFKRYVTDQQVFSNMFEITRAVYYDMAAPYMSQDGTTPEIDNGTMEKFVGSFDAIGNNKKMKQSRYMQLVNNNAKPQAIVEMFDRTMRAVNSNLWRLEDIFLRTLSRTKINLSTLTNNTRGIDKVVDYKVKSSQKSGVATSWSVSATATPFADMKAFVKTQRKAGLTFDRVLMSDTVIDRVLATTEIQNLNIRDNGALDGDYVSLDKLNQFLRLQRLPIIEEVQDNVKFVKKDGVTIDNTLSSWKEDNIVFVTGNTFGTRLWMDPVAEREAARQNAGIFNQIDRMAILDTVDGTDPISFKVMAKFYGTIVLNALYSFGFMSTESTGFQS